METNTPSVNFYENNGQYFEYIDTQGNSFMGSIHVDNQGNDWIEWDAEPEGIDDAEKLIWQNYFQEQYNNQTNR